MDVQEHCLTSTTNNHILSMEIMAILIFVCGRALTTRKGVLQESTPTQESLIAIYLRQSFIINRGGRWVMKPFLTHSLTLGLTCRIPELGECVFNQDLLPLFRKACFRLWAAHNISIDPSFAIRGRGTGQWWRGWQADMEWKDNYDLRRRYIPFNVFLFRRWGWLRGKAATDLLVSWKGCDCHKIPFIRFYLSN